MNIQEFSNSFDTLLNSYSITAGFGEEHSKQEVTLNEYEKSLFLTQAQDVVLKNYLFGVGTIGGLDDNSKKQLDFSSLETVKDLEKIPLKEYSKTYFNTDDESLLTIQGYTSDLDAESLKKKGDPTIAGITDDGLYFKYSDGNTIFVKVDSYDGIAWEQGKVNAKYKCTATCKTKGEKDEFVFYTDAPTNTISIQATAALKNANNKATVIYWKIEEIEHYTKGSKDTSPLGDYYVARAYQQIVNGTETALNYTINMYQLHSTAQNGTLIEIGDKFTLNNVEKGDYTVSSVTSIGAECQNSIYENVYTEHLTYDDRGVLYKAPKNLLFIQNERMRDTRGKNYTIIPISYNEYDRHMSEPYTQPLKKQCWRIIHSNEDTVYELIPIKGIEPALYRIRYIRRPRPIILVDLTADYLDIDGETKVTECELPTLLHNEVLQMAVQLALQSRGIAMKSSKDTEAQQ